MTRNKNIKALQLGLASPETIRSWSYGEVTKSETINYKTLKPELGGLFDEVIFGPTKDYECACGKYKKVKYRGKVCEKCGVEIIESIVRRERMGHIELATPIAHIWFAKQSANSSKISTLLDIQHHKLEEVVYFVNYIVLDAGDQQDILAKKEIIDIIDQKSNKTYRGKLRQLLSIIKSKTKKDSSDYLRASEYYDRLKDSSLPFSIDELFSFISKKLNIKIGIGAEAILELLKEIDIKKEIKIANNEIKKYDSSNPRFKKLMHRLEILRWFEESNNKPEWMILKVIPVTPPDTRPIVQLDGGKFTTSDINNFYRKIIIRNDRLKKIMALNAPSIIVNNEKRMLQEAVDSLFDNATRNKHLTSKDKRPLKSLTEHLKGKQGLFRQNLLGKRVDYSGRSVIVVGPELKMYEAGIPSEMILKLFKPFIIRELIKKYDEYGNDIKPIASNIKAAEKMIFKQNDVIWPIVQKVIKSRPVLLNRAPTLHRLGIQAFEPKMIDGKAIRLHPLVTTAFNADFDGDQMAVHLPLSDEAVKEAREILLASKHILGPKDGKPIIVPTQDMILGCYYLSQEEKGCLGEGVIFNSIDEVYSAYNQKAVYIHAIVGINTKAFKDKLFPKDGILITTIGKIILNTAFPKDAPYVNSVAGMGESVVNDIFDYTDDIHKIIKEWKTKEAFTKKTLQKNIVYLHNNYPVNVVSETMDKVKDQGFNFSTIAVSTISAFDLPSYSLKEKYFIPADEQVNKLNRQFQKGLLTDDERYKKTISLWSKVKDQVTSDIEQIMNDPKNSNNPVVIMAHSGARGNVSQFTQLLGMRGLMSKSFNYDQKNKFHVIRDTIEVPIKHSFTEGLTVMEYFNSSYGARKGMADTAMKTSKSGYMTRKLVDAAQEITITKEDCGATKGLLVEEIRDLKTNTVIESLSSRIANRFAFKDIINPKNKEVLVKKGDIITNSMAEKIELLGIKQVEVRSVLHCECEHGVCQKCFGNDLTTNKTVELGTAIGVVAAQSIGEPGTQLTMRTFHTGGAAGEANITQGFERLKQIFSVIPPKEWESAIISQIYGKVKSIVNTNDGYEIVVKNKFIEEEIIYNVSFNSILRVKEGSELAPGDKITEGSINIQDLLDVAGIDVVRQYMIKEIQKVYRIQGIEISDKYIELIIRQMTNKIKVLNPGNSKFFMGQIIDVNTFTQTNIELINKKQTPIVGVNVIYGLEAIPSKVDSFLSAASFQNTKQILIEAAIKSQKDKLFGLKENVMLGNLIPAGTGFLTQKENNDKKQ